MTIIARSSASIAGGSSASGAKTARQYRQPVGPCSLGALAITTRWLEVIGVERFTGTDTYLTDPWSVAVQETR